MELSNFLQYRLLSALDLKDEDVRIEFKLIPFVNGDTCMKCVEQKTINGVLHLEEGDTVKILAINKGTKNAFFNILDFEPYGNMNLILTGEAQNLNPSSDLLVKYTIAGHTKKLVENPIRIFPPFGNEVFKLIASETPIDLSHIIEVSRSGSEPKSDLSILDKYILNSTGTRGGETGTIKKDKSNGSTYDLNFVIRPKTEPVTAIKKN
jgi:hypothetical protein